MFPEKLCKMELSGYCTEFDCNVVLNGAGFQAKNQEQEQEVLEWIGEVLGEKMPTNVPYEDQLKDGVVLCNLINKISPGSVKKIQTKGSNFQLMENIQRYVNTPLSSFIGTFFFGRRILHRVSFKI